MQAPSEGPSDRPLVKTGLIRVDIGPVLATSPTTSSLRVLVVEDDPDDFEIVARQLGQIGIQDVVWAPSPSRARGELGESQFDVVLVDQWMGEETGLDFIGEVATSVSSPPMIILTGSADHDIDVRASQVGAADYLVKGKTLPEMLERSIRYSVRHHQTLRALETARSELERHLASKNEFLATVSHELRTPLSAVIGLAELLRDPEQSFDSDTRAELIDTIVESGFDVSNLVEDLLTAARHEAGQLKVVAVPVSLRAQINQALESMRAIGDVVVSGDSPKALADPGRVRQILRNLLSNASKYGGGSIRVELGSTGRNVTATVVDDGPGVPPEAVEAVFARYERAHVSDHGGNSVGIGLAISRELARHMGGDLAYQRSASESHFRLTLPVHEGD